MSPTHQQIRIAAFATVPIALLATYFRLYLRIRKGILWWDDFWAFIASVAMVICFAGMIMFTAPPEAHPYSVDIAAYYMVDNGFYGVIWFARVSLMLTVVRIAYGRIRQLLKCCIVAFIVTYLILVAQMFWTCEGDTYWKEELSPQCMLGRQVAIAQLITDILSDLILIIAPSFLLTKMKGRRTLKIRLIAIFSSTFLTTLTSLIHAYAIIRDLGLLEFALVIVENVVSLTVVNLTVIATWAFNLKDDGEEDTGPLHANTFIRGRLSGRSRKNESSTGTNLFALRTFANNGGIEITVDTVRVGDEDDRPKKPEDDKRDNDYHLSDNATVKDKQTITWMADDN